MSCNEYKSKYSRVKSIDNRRTTPEKIAIHNSKKRIESLSPVQIVLQRRRHQLEKMTKDQIESQRLHHRIENMTEEQIEAQREKRRRENMTVEQIMADRIRKRQANMNDEEIQKHRERQRVAWFKKCAEKFEYCQPSGHARANLEIPDPMTAAEEELEFAVNRLTELSVDIADKSVSHHSSLRPSVSVPSSSSKCINVACLYCIFLFFYLLKYSFIIMYLYIYNSKALPRQIFLKILAMVSLLVDREFIGLRLLNLPLLDEARRRKLVTL
jgi:hypothetical protein